MTTEALLGLLEGVRVVKYGWSARCPAHDDHHPSLTVKAGERGLLIRCWTGCRLEEIAGALHIPVRDLFYDGGLSSRARRQAIPKPKPWRDNWRHTAAQLEDHATSLWLRADAVLSAAKGLEASSWTWADEDRELAMHAVGRAYARLERAAWLEELAYSLRSHKLAKEREQDASRCREAS